MSGTSISEPVPVRDQPGYQPPAGHDVLEAEDEFERARR